MRKLLARIRKWLLTDLCNDSLRLVYDLFTDYLRIITRAYVLVYDFIRVILRWLYGLLRVITSNLHVVTSTLRIDNVYFMYAYELFTIWGKV